MRSRITLNYRIRQQLVDEKHTAQLLEGRISRKELGASARSAAIALNLTCIVLILC